MTTAFDEVQFPTGISYASTGGPRRKTEIATLGSGAEERNAVWADSRRDYNAGYGIKDHDDIHAVIAFFEARNAQLRAFRYKDWTDFKSCSPLQTVTSLDQVLTAGVGGYQLTKTYTSGGQSWTRTIKKPVAGTVMVAVEGVDLVSGDWSVDDTTGIVSLLSAPATDSVVTAGFEFDVPARFNTDYLNINMSAFEAGEIPDIPIIEVKI